MLRRLSVENYALIENLEMELSSSLNIVTGETGAGKSILLGALGMVMGNRADMSTLKNSERNCIIEGVFDISGYKLEWFFNEFDLEYDPMTTIRRVITPEGRSRVYINDLPVQLTTLKELSSRLVDIHSQHQSLMVADEKFRTNILDSVASEKELHEKYLKLYSEMREAEKELTKLKAEAESNKRDEEYLRHQYHEIATLKLREGEGAELEAEHGELANAEEIEGALGRACSLLDEDEVGVLPRLKTIAQELRRIAGVYPRGEELSSRIESTYIELKDIESEVESEAQRVEYNPSRLAQLEGRLGAIHSLMQKHKLTSADELIYLERELSSKLEVISNSDEAIAELEDKVKDTFKKASDIAAKITESRKKAAKIVSKQVEDILARLGIASGNFICDITPAAKLSPTGADEILFLFSANKNITPQPLEKIASGGEISRVMLALKSIVAKSNMLPTIIFDEIDTGVSGQIADAMGEILEELSSSMQVVNITHLPQVASKGETHFKVFKQEDNSGTPQTHIKLLSKEERVEEIAKMLSGSKITDAAIIQAKSLLSLK